MRKNRKVRKVVDTTIYTLRNMVDRCFNKLKNSRRLATLYAGVDGVTAPRRHLCARVGLR